ncbi:ROK family transcriptional regulator [Tropicimonas sp. IMCC34043]|uniref:ROK family transcriptional regulator n=1 Tax=Tropicimonas sp. IMCC34043 TaxID=2248760 RepID=UPI0013009631|nr:ROK family transcriptional regulator [Tropicimonas sp. IMCC34043]
MRDDENLPPNLRQISVRSAMNILIRGARSRADLAKDTGLSKQTMSEVMKSLEAAGWVRDVGTTTGRLGRSAILYEIDSHAGAVLGLDVGATRVKLALTDVLGAPLAARELRTDSLRSDRLVEEIMDRANTLIAEAGDGRRLRHACLATPGAINPATGQLAMAPNLPSLTGINLGAVLREGLGCEVTVENDVNAAIVGERWQGEARNADFAAYVALGTGIGLGLVAGGQLLRGASGAAGEVSYLPIGSDSLEPDSIARGALERSLGVRSVLADFLDPEGTAATVRRFAAAVDAGAPEALAAQGRIGELGALLVLSVQAMFDPAVIVVGGILGLVPSVFDRLEAELMRRTARPVHLVRGSLGLQATVTGATYLALTGMFNQVFSPQTGPQLLDLPWPVPQAGSGDTTNGTAATGAE